MKIVILTTETPHHVFFVREIAKHYDNIKVFCEIESGRKFFYNTQHKFEIERDAYELDTWFNGNNVTLKNISDVIYVPTINKSTVYFSLMSENPDIIIVFGTGVIEKELASLLADRVYNLHGGNPEQYRGLDSHLWSIYHNDFKNLITTVHKLEVGLDTGDVILQGEVPLWKGMRIHHLRASNTELCVRLSISFIDIVSRHGSIISRPQYNKGKYYSAMPSDLKEFVKNKFEKFINKKFDVI